VWRHDLLLRPLDLSRKVGPVSDKPTYQAGSRVTLANELGFSHAKGISPRTSCVISSYKEGMAEIEKKVVIFPGNRTALSSRGYVY
jgi:hypothetical protein